MHRLILIICIALLPLRSWAGDLMGLQMALQSSIQAVASSPANTSHKPVISAQADVNAAHSDCAEHGRATMQATQAAPDPAHCSTCVSCQICHSLAMVILPTSVATQVIQGMPPAQGAPKFASAEQARSQKPPIS